MTINDLKKKGMKGIKTVIYGRTLFVVMAFLIQFSLMVSVYIFLKDYSLLIYTAFGILGILVIFHLYNDRENPDLKLVWMLPILVFPVFGAVLYLYITTQPGTKIIRRRLENLEKETREYVKQDEQTRKDLNQQSRQMGHFADYMYHIDMHMVLSY